MTVVGTYDSEQQKIFFTRDVDIDGNIDTSGSVDIDGNLNIDGNININGNMTFNGVAPSDSDGLTRSVSYSIDWRNADDTLGGLLSSADRANFRILRHHRDPMKFFVMPKTTAGYHDKIYEFEFGSTRETRISGITQTNFFDFSSKLNTLGRTGTTNSPPFFTNDGTKLYFIGGGLGNSGTVYVIKFNLSTPFDITTADSGTRQTKATSSGRTEFTEYHTPASRYGNGWTNFLHWFNRDGTRLYTSSALSSSVETWSIPLSTANELDINSNSTNRQEYTPRISHYQLPDRYLETTQSWIDSADSDGSGNPYEFYGQSSFYTFTVRGTPAETVTVGSSSTVSYGNELGIVWRGSGVEFNNSLPFYDQVESYDYIGADPTILTIPSGRRNGGFIFAGIRDWLDSTDAIPGERSIANVEMYYLSFYDSTQAYQDGFNPTKTAFTPITWTSILRD